MMDFSDVGVSSRSRRAETEDKTRLTTETDPITQSEEIARYLGEDLAGIVKQANIDLKTYLHVSQESLLDMMSIVKRLCADIEQMLRHRLIRGVHLLLSDPSEDPSVSNATHTLSYHARYLIYQPERVLRGGSELPWGGPLLPPPDATGGMRFAVLIEWSPDSSADDRACVHWPTYLFNWVPEGATFDAAGLVSYKFGGLMAAGATVTRVEFSTPENLRRAANAYFDE